jgi:hypothetical protein
VAEGLTQVEAEQINQYLTAEKDREEPAAAQDADEQSSPQDFIPAPDGGLDYGEITPEMGKAMRRQAGKIRLQHGVQNSNGTGWGLVHIEANHGKQISGLGFGSVQDFVAHVASSIQQVWQVPGNSQLLLTLKDGRKDVMYIQLEIAKEGDFYRVNSAFPVRQEDYESLKGMKKIWDGSEPTSAVTGQRPAFATAASASPESESSQGSSNARGQDASVPPAPATPQPITRADVTAAQQQAAAIITERIDAMKAGDVNKIAKRFLPTMGVKPTVSKERNKAAMTDFTKVNLMAAADEVGVRLPADVRRALDAEMQGRVADVGQDDGVNPRVPRENRAQAKPIEQGEQKEPWQMTAMEFGQQERGNPHWNQSYAGKDDGAYLADVQATHARLVQEAIDAGKLITEPAAKQTPQDGSKSYSDGQQLGADDLLAYFDRVIAGSQKGEKIVNPRFQIGAVDAGTAQEIANYIDGYDGQQRNLRVSGRTLKHIHESRPAIAREILGQLPGMFSKPDEVLPDPKHKNKRALLVKERQTEEGQSKPKSYVATVEVEIEIEVKDGFIDIVTIMTAPERSLKEARELKKNWPEGQQRTEQAVNSPHPLTAEAANPAADSPDARPVGVSVPPTVPAPQPDTPKLTTAEAKSLMAWEDLGQKDGVKTHALTFYESQADKDVKRGRMIVAKVSKEVDSGNWTVEGTGEKLAVLGMAKKKAEQVGMEKAVADGFVEQGAEAPKSTEKPAAPATTSASIEDAGEKIGGARKDRWKERGLNLDDLDAMTEAEGAELATKANVWKPDYEALSKASEPVTAAMVKTIYDQLAAKPKKNTPEGRRQYVQMMRIV